MFVAVLNGGEQLDKVVPCLVLVYGQAAPRLHVVCNVPHHGPAARILHHEAEVRVADDDLQRRDNVDVTCADEGLDASLRGQE